eukprot:TRINITY_DN12798_c0_g2_i7.p1 TRINITY_DN12798_c0_g2~~TRINITY_DN12798_c0_g2_i7.p1  ORF type:complete len:225 (-),score=48.11 TRINITY_DN12798_c0_g2_i7:687-1361(-)
MCIRDRYMGDILMESATLILGYWPFKARVEQIKLLLEYLGVPYVIKLYTQPEEWARDKKSLNFPFPNLPYIKDGDVVVCETDAIFHYICLKMHRPELLGKTIRQINLQRQLKGVLDELLDVLLGMKKGDDARKIVSDKITPKLGSLSKFLGTYNFLLDDLTIADVKLFYILEILTTYDKNILKQYENLTKFYTRFLEIPNIALYKKSDRHRPGPFFVPDHPMRI